MSLSSDATTTTASATTTRTSESEPETSGNPPVPTSESKDTSTATTTSSTSSSGPTRPAVEEIGATHLARMRDDAAMREHELRVDEEGLQESLQSDQERLSRTHQQRLAMAHELRSIPSPYHLQPGPQHLRPRGKSNNRAPT
jgi:hypothetical protein